MTKNAYRSDPEPRSLHPYKPFIPETAERLIIGTIPPYRFCRKENGLLPQLEPGDVDFYYGSRKNEFWSLISAVSGEAFSRENTRQAVEERKAYLERNRLAMTDVICSCCHRGGNSSDRDLAELQLRDLRLLLAEHPGIDTLIYTSDFVKQLVNREVTDRHRHAAVRESSLPLPQTLELGRLHQCVINGKTYCAIRLYSPSPMARFGVDQETRLAQYRELFSR